MFKTRSRERRFRDIACATAAVFAAAWSLLGPAHAAPSTCAGIEDATARLACYDQQNAVPQSADQPLSDQPLSDQLLSDPLASDQLSSDRLSLDEQAAQQRPAHAEALPAPGASGAKPPLHAGASPMLEPALPSRPLPDRVDAPIQANGTRVDVAAPTSAAHPPSSASQASRSTTAQQSPSHAGPGVQGVDADKSAASADAFGVHQGGLFDDGAAEAFAGERLESTIAAARRAPKQNTMFRLVNDQIWMQDAPREVPIHPGDRVSILRGLIGGYVMRNDDGATTRVRRIR